MVTLITQDWVEELPLLGKDEVAGKLLTVIAAQRQTMAAEE